MQTASTRRVENARRARARREHTLDLNNVLETVERVMATKVDDLNGPAAKALRLFQQTVSSEEFAEIWEISDRLGVFRQMLMRVEQENHIGGLQLRFFSATSAVSLHWRRWTRKVKAISEELCGRSLVRVRLVRSTSSLITNRDASLGGSSIATIPIWPSTHAMKACGYGVTRSRAVLVAIGMNREGRRQVLRVEMASPESSRSWEEVLPGLKRRGMRE